MENAPPQQRFANKAASERGPWIVAALSLPVFHLVWQFQGEPTAYWLPGVGIGIALVSWLGWRVLPALLFDLILVHWLVDSSLGWPLILTSAVLHTSLIGAAWWMYHQVAHGSRWLDDPQSAAIFLILVPGGCAALTAVLQGFARELLNPDGIVIWEFAVKCWLSQMVGILVMTPFLLIVMTPILMRLRMIPFDLPTSFFGETPAAARDRGESIELAGLTVANSVLAPLLLFRDDPSNFALWGCSLILIVWTCVRQGLRGGCFAATIASVTVLMVVQTLNVREGIQSGLQGNLLAFCSTALLVGVASSWVRANEARYRHVVSRIPVVLYSARLPQPIQPQIPAGPRPTSDPELKSPHPKSARDSKRELNLGPSISKVATVLLVSPASKEILGCEAASLVGPYALFLERIVPGDHELVTAALAQLCLQQQPVSCEYRVLLQTSNRSTDTAAAGSRQLDLFRWVRDTMTPHYTADGLVDGWEGLVEDITEQRALSQNLRKISNMLQVLITNLPTGVFFVQAPSGYPILVNARARQLLGQREDMSAGLAHLSRIYRLHRPDGSVYPPEELPISKALQLGVACRANDIVVHRSDGRKIPLIAWAAPVDLGNTGVPDAAVWVLEDLSAMQQAEIALRESEVRLRAVIETMGEGVIVQDADGVIIECNPAACTILNSSRDRLLYRTGMIGESAALQEDGTLFGIDQHPDRRALRDGQAVTGVILGLRLAPGGPTRWLLVNSMPLPVGPGLGMSRPRARVVTTFADITSHLEFQESLKLEKERYQQLIESMPFMMIRRDREFNITYMNPAASELTGYTAEQMAAPGFFRQVIPPDDLPIALDAVEKMKRGEASRAEYRLTARNQTIKTVLAFVQPAWHAGEVVGSTSLLIDITTQRRLEEELRRARQLELVGKLASGTVHDFNNLVFVMMSLAELAKLELPGNHSSRPHLTRLAEVGEQASHLAGQILAFGKQRTKDQYPVDLNNVVTQTLKLLKSVIPGEIVVEAKLESANPIITGNDGQLKQVLMNLCLNARDSMPSGGRLTIATDHSAPPARSLDNGYEEPWIHLSITDTGHGMEESVRARIFEPFFSTKERGTGLGMAVVQQIIQEFGGRIEVWSQPQVGTRMDIWFPQTRTGIAESI